MRIILFSAAILLANTALNPALAQQRGQQADPQQQLQLLCQLPKPAKISIKPKSKKLVIDTSRPIAKLQQQKMGTINPYGYNTSSHTNGFMKAEMETRHLIKLNHKPVLEGRGYCVFYDTVRIEIDIIPKIVIAKEVAADKCMYAAVSEHEKKHVTADRKVINAFAKSIGAKLHDGLKQRGFIAGPMPPDQVEPTAKRMRETVSQIIKFESKKMEIQRAEAQQAIDTLEEYQSVQAKCPDYIPPNMSK